MKKLITLFSFLAFFSLIFIGCQSEDIIAPDDLSKQNPPPAFEWDTPAETTSPVDLIAGQHNLVGSVIIEKLDGGLKFTYDVNEGCSVSEMHIDLTYDPADFNVNKNNSPVFGNFDSKKWATFDYDNYTVTFDATGLAGALGGPPAGTIYMAIHGVVCCGGDPVPVSGFCPDLSGAQGAMLLQGLGNAFVGNPPVLQPGSTHYMNNLRFTKTVIEGVDVFKGWCLDPARGVDFPSEEPQYYERPLNFICSTDETISTCVIHYPENLWKVNWIINNRGSYSIGAVQVAIWMLLSDGEYSTFMHDFDAEAEALLAEIPDTWSPECGDKVLVIVYETATTEPCDVMLQPIGIEVEVECEYTQGECETAMAFPYIAVTEPGTNTSSLFNHQWFRYIAFNY